jgi:antitoxin (DNA-binding transcriptional repressor) of toxin-antitoxin stability system
MSETITLEEAQSNLSELIDCLQPGTEIVITRNNQPVAELHLPMGTTPLPRFGNCQGALTMLAEDDEHLLDFKEYIPLTLETVSPVEDAARLIEEQRQRRIQIEHHLAREIGDGHY